MKTFQPILLGIFVFLAVVGVLIFAGIGINTGGNAIGNVMIWGTLPQAQMQAVLEDIRLTRSDFSGVSYIAKDPRTYQSDLIEALAAGKGPDLFLLSQDRILQNYDKILRIPYSTLSERAFKDKYIAEGDILLFPDIPAGNGQPAQAGGIAGLPFTIDPLVMYWNRSIFADTGIATPPQFWDSFFALSQKITKRNQANTVLRATAPLGEYANIPNAKSTLTALFLQAGDPIVSYGNDGVTHTVLSATPEGQQTPPGEAALRFYTEFSDPTKVDYTWNRALPSARDMFTAGDLAVYFGFASELPTIRNANPNLDFDVAELPQIRDAKTKATFGNMLSLAIPRTSVNVKGAYTTASVLSDTAVLTSLGNKTFLPPVLRSMLATAPSQAFQNVFYSSALIAKAWLDPNPDKSQEVFRAMIENTTSGKSRPNEAIVAAEKELENLLRGK